MRSGLPLLLCAAALLLGLQQCQSGPLDTAQVQVCRDIRLSDLQRDSASARSPSYKATATGRVLGLPTDSADTDPSLAACAKNGGRVAVTTEAGDTNRIGFQPMTPTDSAIAAPLDVRPGQTVTLQWHAPLRYSTDGGFVVTDSAGLLAAAVGPRGSGTEFSRSDLDGLRVQVGKALESVRSTCGTRRSFALRAEAPADTVVVRPGEQKQLRHRGQVLRVFNGGWVKLEGNGSCRDARGSVRWALWRDARNAERR